MRRRLTILCLFLACLLEPLAVSPPTAFAEEPQLVGSCSLPYYARVVALAGDHAYVSDEGGLEVVDVSDPTAPFVLGFCSLPDFGFSVAIAGRYAYVGDLSGGLQVVDVSDPRAPHVAASCSLPGCAKGVAVAGDYAYVAMAGSPADDEGSPDERSGLQVVDVSNPTAPVIAGFCPLPSNAWGVAVAGHYAYVGDGSSGLRVVNIANPLRPAVVGSRRLPDYARSVAVAGDYAYVADSWGGLQIVDVFDLSHLQVVGSCDLPDYAVGVAVAGDHAYVGAMSGGLQVVDVSQAAAPLVDGACALQGNAEGVTVAGTYAYVAAGGLQVVDVHAMPALGLSASAKPAVVGYNGLVTVRGWLRDALGALLPGRTLVLQSSTNRTSWSDVRSVGSATGEYVATTRIVRKTYFRWRFAGDDIYAAGASPSCLVKCRASLTPVALPSLVRVGVKYVRYGYLRPQHALGRAPLTVWFYRYRSGGWRLMATVRDSRWDNVSGATRYGIQMRLSSSWAGTWRTRTMHEDADHVRTYSAYRTFVVR